MAGKRAGGAGGGAQGETYEKGKSNSSILSSGVVQCNGLKCCIENEGKKIRWRKTRKRKGGEEAVIVFLFTRVV